MAIRVIKRYLNWMNESSYSMDEFELNQELKTSLIAMSLTVASVQMTRHESYI